MSSHTHSVLSCLLTRGWWDDWSVQGESRDMLSSSAKGARMVVFWGKQSNARPYRLHRRSHRMDLNVL